MVAMKVRALVHLHKKPGSKKNVFSKEEKLNSKGPGSPKDMSSKEEKLDSKGGGELLDISIEKVDGEVRALLHLHSQHSFPKDMSSMEEKLNIKGV
eukprot:2723556-Ditylum_brightwellii.AAC.1